MAEGIMLRPKAFSQAKSRLEASKRDSINSREAGTFSVEDTQLSISICCRIDGIAATSL